MGVGLESVLRNQLLLDATCPVFLPLTERHLVEGHQFTFSVPAGERLLWRGAFHTGRKTKPSDSVKTRRI